MSRSSFPISTLTTLTPQLTTPHPVVVAAESATNLGTKTAPIFAVSFYGSVDFQPLTEIREPPAVPCAPAFSSVQSSKFKVSRFPASHFVPAWSRRHVPPKPGGGGSSERRRKGSALCPTAGSPTVGPGGSWRVVEGPGGLWR